jgi:putative glycosyltransferase (TIGR04372 family)
MIRGKQKFIRRQITHIREGGYRALLHKLKLFAALLLTMPAHILAVPVVLAARLLRPFVILRAGMLTASRIGPLAWYTELFLCERDARINVPARRHVDLFYFDSPICNRQLATMWARTLRILPARLMAPICRVNRLIPGGAANEVGQTTVEGYDVHDVLDRFQPHLGFSTEEEARGKAGMEAMGIPPDTPFVCLIVRDSAYLEAHMPGSWQYHDYRDCDIRHHVLAAEELVRRGYCVVRMGAKVRDVMPVSCAGIIDYATNGMRTDFMDVYLGSKCAFCISTNTGYDAVPAIFRRPIVFVNSVPLGYLHAYRRDQIGITKHHHDARSGRELRLREIVDRGAGLSLRGSEYEAEGVRLVENTPEEIRDVVVEMVERLEGRWRPHEEDAALQECFWRLFPKDTALNGARLYGEIRYRFGAAFLRNNRWWLDS